MPLFLARQILLSVIVVTTDTRMPASWLCNAVHYATNSSYCHVALRIQGQPLPSVPPGDYLLENAMRTELPDVISGETNRSGAQLLSFAARREQWASVRERPLGKSSSQAFAKVFWTMRNVSFSPDMHTLLRMLALQYSDWPQHLVCSTFLAKFLFRLGCIPMKTPELFNAFPKDFANDTAIVMGSCSR